MRWFPTSFRQRVALLFVALSLVVGVPTYWYLDRVYSTHLIDRQGQTLHALATSVAAALAQNLHERQRENALLAQMPLYRQAPLDSPELRSSLERHQASYPDYSWIGIADLDGEIRVATGGVLTGANVRHLPWFSQGLSGPSIIGPIEAPMLGAALQEKPLREAMRLIDFSSPILDEAGRVRGVLGFRAHRDWVDSVVGFLGPLVQDTIGFEIFVINRDNAVIYPVTPALRELPGGATRSEGPYYLDDTSDGTRYITSVAPVPDTALSNRIGWRVVLRQPSAQVLAGASDLKAALVSFEILATLVFAGLAWWIAGLLSKPIHELSSLARQIEHGEEHVDFAVKTGSFEVRELIGALHGMSDTLETRKQALIESNRRVMERSEELEKANEGLRKLSRRDALTGLANRLSADERLNDEFVRMKRTEAGYAVLMMDIDFFKRVNDTYGHAVGDEVLKHVGRILKATVRESDFVARYGGEEFLAILPATRFEDACQVAGKIQQAIGANPMLPVGSITISVGLALASPAQLDHNEVVHQADDWLYEAKRSGRNRVAGSGIRWTEGRLTVRNNHPVAPDA